MNTDDFSISQLRPLCKTSKDPYIRSDIKMTVILTIKPTIKRDIDEF